MVFSTPKLSAVFLSISFLCGFTYADLPSDIPKCAGGDGVCIAKTITQILRKYPKGSPDFGLRTVNEVVLHDIVIAEPKSNTPIQVNLIFKTMKVYGVEDTNVTKVVGFQKDPRKSKFEVYGIIPNLRLKCDYEIAGKLLLLPIFGSGDSEFKFKNMRVGVKVKVRDSVREDGKRYIAISGIKTTVEIDNMYSNMENLFGDNRELGESMNRIINENWKDVWDELRDGINHALAGIVKVLISNVLDKLAYDDFFKKD